MKQVLKIGQKVHVKCGPFKDKFGEIQELKPGTGRGRMESQTPEQLS